MRPKNTSLIAVLSEGHNEAQKISVSHQVGDSKSINMFAGRMVVRLYWAMERIKELEAAAIENSWRADPDRSGGQFTQDEVAARNDWV
jgi:hypothetical protein